MTFMLQEDEKKILEAVKEDSEDKLNALLKGKDLRLKNGNSVCHITAEYGKIAIFKKYISDDMVEKCFTNESGDTWLHMAARSGNIEIGRYIVEEFGEKVFKFKHNNEGKTAIDVALSSALSNENKCQHSSKDIAQDCIDFIYKLDKGVVKKLIEDNETKLPLYSLAALGMSKFIVEFFDCVDKIKTDENDNTALHRAIKGRHFDTLKSLVSLFGDGKKLAAYSSSSPDLETLLKSQNKDRETPLHFAMKSADVSTIVLLLERGSDPFTKDSQGNTPLEELVKYAEIDPENTFDIIKSIGLESSKTDINKGVLMDILQIASKQGKEYYKIVEYLVKKLDFSQLPEGDDDEHTILYDLLCAATENDQEDIQDIIKSLSPEYLKNTVKRVEDEPIWHVIAANGLTSLVNDQKLQFIDKCSRDKRGDTILHTAARNKRWATLERFVRTFDGESQKHFLNEKDKDEETVLHIAFKHTEQISVIQTLIQKGGDLAAKDKDGNTPLHDLVEKAATDENVDKYIDVWKVLVDNAVCWWCLKFEMKLPYKSEDIYRIYQRDALYYLRSEVTNKEGLSVIEFAAAEGIVRIVKEMIWVEGVFVRESNDGKKVKINITKFMPELGDSSKVKYLTKSTGYKYMALKEKIKSENQRVDLEIPKSDTSLLDAVLEVEEGNKANDIFQIQPIHQLVRDHWFVHQWWTFIMLVAHLIYMSLYSSYSLDMIAKATVANETNVSSGESLKADFNYMIWPLILVVLYIVTLATTQQNCQKLRKKSIRDRLLRETNIDIKDIFNWPSVLLSGIVLIIPLLTPLLFCLVTISALALTKYNSAFFNDTASLSVIIGWLLTFYWASAFEPVYRFLSVLKRIVLKDIMSFLFFYIFVLLAYSYGIFIIMSGVPNLLKDFPTLQEVMFELLLVGCGVESRMSSDTIGKEFEIGWLQPFVLSFTFHELYPRYFGWSIESCNSFDG